MSNFQGIRAVLRLMAATVLSLLVAFAASAQTVRYVHTDALGSVVLVTDRDRNVVERGEYEPYGSLVNRQIADGPGYTGHVMDAATGLTYMQQRYYDQAIGVFLSVDPVAASFSPSVSFNRYRYGNSNPYKFTDPDGRDSIMVGYGEIRRYIDGSCDGDVVRCMGLSAGGDGQAGNKSSVTTMPTMEVTARKPKPDPYKVMAAGIRAINSGRLAAEGLMKLGLAGPSSVTGVGTVPGVIGAASGSWNLYSSFTNYKNARQLLNESYTTDSTNYTWRQKLTTVVVGGAYPFGTLSDDPGEPMYKDAVVQHFKSMLEKDPAAAIGEVGTISP
ncbi:RHS repeat-associated core domain-containing protein [Xanthomonas sp. PPL139]|uniref:RHS repeat-associated core domain-containing protein n=1 Tax=unclassified Xanthomonas TaxID=2643310 RepID=UPI0033B31214